MLLPEGLSLFRLVQREGIVIENSGQHTISSNNITPCLFHAFECAQPLAHPRLSPYKRIDMLSFVFVDTSLFYVFDTGVN